MSYSPTIKKKYTTEVVPALMKQYNYKSVMQVPKLLKIVINQGVGAAVGDKKLIDNAVDEISRIAGQKAIATMSKKAISTALLSIKISAFSAESKTPITFNIENLFA